MAVASAGPYASLHLAPGRYHASIPPLSFLRAGCPFCRPTNSVKALRHWYQLDHFPLNSRQTIITASSLLNFYKLHTFRDTQQTQLKQCREKWHIPVLYIITPLTLSFTLPLEFVALSTIIIIITTNIMSCNVT